MSSSSHSSSVEDNLELGPPKSPPENNKETHDMTISEEITDFLTEDREVNFSAVEFILSLLPESMNRVHEVDLSGTKRPRAEGTQGLINHQCMISPNHTATNPRRGVPCNCGDYHPILVPEPKPETLPPNVILKMVFEALERNWLTEERKMDLIRKVPEVTVFGIKDTRAKIQGAFYMLPKNMAIICTCHGIIFSPNQFISHAGGNQEEAENPWNYINVA